MIEKRDPINNGLILFLEVIQLHGRGTVCTLAASGPRMIVSSMDLSADLFGPPRSVEPAAIGLVNILPYATR